MEIFNRSFRTNSQPSPGVESKSWLPSFSGFRTPTLSQLRAAARYASSVLTGQSPSGKSATGLTGAAGPGSANAGSPLQPASQQQMKAASERAAKILNPKVTDATAKFMSTEIGTAHQLLEKIKQQVGDQSTIVTIDEFVKAVKELNNALKAIDTSSSDISGKHQAEILKGGLSATDVLTQQSLISGKLHAMAEKEVKALWAKVHGQATSQMGRDIAQLPVQKGAVPFLDAAKKISDQMQKLEEATKSRDFLDLVPPPNGTKSHPVPDSVHVLTQALRDRFEALGQRLVSRSTSVEDTFSALAAVRQLVIDPKFKGLSARLVASLGVARETLNDKFLSQIEELDKKISAHIENGEISAAEKLRDRLEAIQKAPDYELTKVSQAQRSKIGALLTDDVTSRLTQVVSRQSRVIAEKQLVGKLDENDSYFADGKAIESIDAHELLSSIDLRLGTMAELEAKAEQDPGSRSRSSSGATSVASSSSSGEAIGSWGSSIKSTKGTSLAESRATLTSLNAAAQLLVDVGELSTKITTALTSSASMSAADAKDLLAELRKFVDAGRGQRLEPSPTDGLVELSSLSDSIDADSMSDISSGHDALTVKTPVELKLQSMVNAEIAKVASRYQEIAALAADLQLVEDLSADTSSFQAATNSREKLDALNATLRPDIPDAHESEVVTNARDALKAAQSGAFKEIVAHISSVVTIPDSSQPSFKPARMTELRDAVALYSDLEESQASKASQANQQSFHDLRDQINRLQDHILASQIDFPPTANPAEEVKALREAAAFCDSIGVNSSTLQSKLQSKISDTEARLGATLRKIEDSSAFSNPTIMAADIKKLETQLDDARATFGDVDGIDRVFSRVATRLTNAFSEDCLIGYESGTTEQRKSSMAAGLAIVTGLASVGRLVGKPDWPLEAMSNCVSDNLKLVVEEEFASHQTALRSAGTLEAIETCEAKVQESAQILGGPHFDPNGAVAKFLKRVGARSGEAAAVDELQLAKVQVAREYVDSVMDHPTQPIDYARLTRYHDVLSQIPGPEIEDEITLTGHSHDTREPGVRTPRLITVPIYSDSSSIADDILENISVELPTISSLRDSTLELIAQLRQPAFRQVSQFAELTQKLAVPGSVHDIVSELVSPQLVSPSDEIGEGDGRIKTARGAFTDAFLSNKTLSTDDRIAIGAALIRSKHTEWQIGEDERAPLSHVAQDLSTTLVYKWSADLATMADPADQVQYFKTQCDEIQKLGLDEDLSKGLLTKMTEEFDHHAKLPDANADPAAVHVARTLMSIKASHPIVYPEGSKVNAFQKAVVAAHSTALAGRLNMPVVITPQSATVVADQLAGLRAELLGSRDDVEHGLTAKVRTQCTALLEFEVDTPTVNKLENIFLVKRLMDAMPVAEITGTLTDTVAELVDTINTPAGNPAHLTTNQLDMFAEVSKMPGLPKENVDTAKEKLTAPWAAVFKARITDPNAKSHAKLLLDEWQRFEQFAKGNAAIMEREDIKALRPTIAYLKVVQTANQKQAALEAVSTMALTPPGSPDVKQSDVESILMVMGDPALAEAISETGKQNLRGRVEAYFGNDGDSSTELNGYTDELNATRGRGILYGMGITRYMGSTLDSVATRTSSLIELAQSASKAFPSENAHLTASETFLKALPGKMQPILDPYRAKNSSVCSNISNAVATAAAEVDKAVAERQRTNIETRLTKLRAADTLDPALYKAVAKDIKEFGLHEDSAVKAQFLTAFSHAIRAMKPTTAEDILKAADNIRAVRQVVNGTSFGVGPQVDSAIKDMLKAQMKGYFEGLKISPEALKGNGAELPGIQDGVDKLDGLPAIFPSLAGPADNLGSGISGDLVRAKAYKNTQLQVAWVICALKSEEPLPDLAVALRADISDELSRPVQTLMQEIAGMSEPDERALNRVVADYIQDQPGGASALAVKAQLLRHSDGESVGAVTVRSFSDQLGDYLRSGDVSFAHMSGEQMNDSLHRLNQFLDAVGGGDHTQKLPANVQANVGYIVNLVIARISDQAPIAADNSWEGCREQLDILRHHLGLTDTQSFGAIVVAQINDVQGRILTGPQRETRDAISALNRLPENSTAQQLHDSIKGLVERLGEPENFTEQQKADLKAAIAAALPKLGVVAADLQGQAVTIAGLLETLNGPGASVKPDDFDASRGAILDKFVAKIRAAIVVPIPLAQWGDQTEVQPVLRQIPAHLNELDAAQKDIVSVQQLRVKTAKQLDGIRLAVGVAGMDNADINSAIVAQVGTWIANLAVNLPYSFPEGMDQNTVTIGALVQHITDSDDPVPGLTATATFEEEIGRIKGRLAEIAEFKPVCTRMDALQNAVDVAGSEARAAILNGLDHLEPKGGIQAEQDRMVLQRLTYLSDDLQNDQVPTVHTLMVMANLLRLAPQGTADAPSENAIPELNMTVFAQKLQESVLTAADQRVAFAELLVQFDAQKLKLSDPIYQTMADFAGELLGSPVGDGIQNSDHPLESLAVLLNPALVETRMRRDATSFFDAVQPFADGTSADTVGDRLERILTYYQEYRGEKQSINAQCVEALLRALPQNQLEDTAIKNWIGVMMQVHEINEHLGLERSASPLLRRLSGLLGIPEQAERVNVFQAKANVIGSVIQNKPDGQKLVGMLLDRSITASLKAKSPTLDSLLTSRNPMQSLETFDGQVKGWVITDPTDGGQFNNPGKDARENLLALVADKAVGLLCNEGDTVLASTSLKDRKKLERLLGNLDAYIDRATGLSEEDKRRAIRTRNAVAVANVLYQHSNEPLTIYRLQAIPADVRQRAMVARLMERIASELEADGSDEKKVRELVDNVAARGTECEAYREYSGPDEKREELAQSAQHEIKSALGQLGQVLSEVNPDLWELIRGSVAPPRGTNVSEVRAQIIDRKNEIVLAVLTPIREQWQHILDAENLPELGVPGAGIGEVSSLIVSPPSETNGDDNIGRGLLLGTDN